MRLVFPAHPLSPKAVDSAFAEEFDAAQAVGFPVGLIDFSAVERGSYAEALRWLAPPDDAETSILHRTWMFTGEQYAGVHAALVAAGFRPIVPPAAYEQAHYLPQAYVNLEGITPRTAWVAGDNLEDAWTLYSGFRESDAVIKDHVKSAKHRWREACFIPRGSERENFAAIFRDFRAARGSRFERGVVLRRFEPLVELARDMRGFPIHEEYRVFFYGGRLLVMADRLEQQVPAARWQELIERGGRFGTPFLSMDIARTSAGEWTVIEVGDGGVSGIPGTIPVEEFYRRLRSASRLGPSTDDF